MRFPGKITSSCIWVAIPVDWVILHWYTCCADGRSGGRCTVKWLPSFLGWVVYHIFLPIVLRCAFRARELRYYITYFLVRLEIGVFILASFKSEEVLEVVNFVWNKRYVRSDRAQNHSETVSPDDIPRDHWYSVSFQFYPLFSNPASESSLLGHLKLFLTRVFVFAAVVDDDYLFYSFFFRRKNWKNTLLTGRFLITESRRHKNNILSGRASDITRWRRLPCIYLSRYSLPASRK